MMKQYTKGIVASLTQFANGTLEERERLSDCVAGELVWTTGASLWISIFKEFRLVSR